MDAVRHKANGEGRVTMKKVWLVVFLFAFNDELLSWVALTVLGLCLTAWFLKKVMMGGK